jgi:hypothetical protein
VSRKTTCKPIEPKRVVHARLTVRRAAVRFYNAIRAGLFRPTLEIDPPSARTDARRREYRKIFGTEDSKAQRIEIRNAPLPNLNSLWFEVLAIV